MSSGATTFLAGTIGAGIVDEGEAEMRVLHLGRGILAIQSSSRAVPFAAFGEGEGNLADRDDRETAGLVAGIDVGDIGEPSRAMS